MSDLVRTDGAPRPWEAQLDLVRRTVANGATDDEFALFLHQARRTGLDPLARQIYCVKRGKGQNAKATIQTGIDGFRLVADRTGAYVGSDDAVFEGEQTSEWKSYDQGGRFTHPLKATVTIRKMVQGYVGTFTATARWSEYYPGDAQGNMWRKMPHTMLAKCAEALALRKAFPADLSGIYTSEEMDQAGDPSVIEAECVDLTATEAKHEPEKAAPKKAADPEEVKAKKQAAEFMKRLELSADEEKSFRDMVKGAGWKAYVILNAAETEGVTCWTTLELFVQSLIQKRDQEAKVGEAA